MSEQLRYAMIRRAFAATPWAILESKYYEIRDFIAFKAAGGEIAPEDIQARFGAAATRQKPQQTGQVAVLPVVGTIAHRMGLLGESSGGVSTERLTQDFRALVNDPAIGAIVLDMDSPGGSADGIDELAAEIYQARRIKPVTAVANGLMASAAYWLAASASEVVVTPSSLVGSIGVVAAHEDQSGLYEQLGVKVSLVTAGKYKAENNPFGPLTDEGQAHIQAIVDEAYGRFTRAVARGRGVPVEDVRGGFGEGRVVTARDALTMGMADRMATLDEVVSGHLAAQTTDTQGQTAALVAVPYEAHGRRVLADLAAFTQASHDRAAYRRHAEAGRNPLSRAHRQQLIAIEAELRDALVEMGLLLAETEPEQDRQAAARRLEAARRRFLLADVDVLLAR
jgi:capsid assembly protease